MPSRSSPAQLPCLGAFCCSLLRACTAASVILLAFAFDDGDEFQPTLSRYHHAPTPPLTGRICLACTTAFALHFYHHSPNPSPHAPLSFFRPESSASFKLVSRNVFDLQCVLPRAPHRVVQ